MKKPRMAHLLALLALVGACSSQAQFAKPEAAIKYRQSAFTLMGAHFGRLAEMAQGKAPFDAKVAQDNEAIFAVVSKLPWSAFTEGSDKGETKAKPEIWSDAAKFKEAQDKLMSETVKLNAAVKTGKLEDLKVAVGAVGGACKNCHDQFRAK
jgi:cytochrome c556